MPDVMSKYVSNITAAGGDHSNKVICFRFWFFWRGNQFRDWGSVGLSHAFVQTRGWWNKIQIPNMCIPICGDWWSCCFFPECTISILEIQRNNSGLSNQHLGWVAGLDSWRLAPQIDRISKVSGIPTIQNHQASWNRAWFQFSSNPIETVFSGVCQLVSYLIFMAIFIIQAAKKKSGACGFDHDHLGSLRHSAVAGGPWHYFG